MVRPLDSCPNCRPDPRMPGSPKAPPNDPNARYIPLSQGRFAIVDTEDYEELAKRKWYCSAKKNRAYAMRRRPGAEKRILMHRWIMNAPDNLFVDHIDGNGLNNRRANLRLCTPAQNARNRRPDRNCHSKYKGVTWGKLQNKWLATISNAGRHTHLGCFKNEIDAAITYDRKAQTLHAQFAYLNFPELAEFRKHLRNLIWA